MNTLLATSTHNTKATEIENKIADTSNLVRKTYCNTKIKHLTMIDISRLLNFIIFFL